MLNQQKFYINGKWVSPASSQTLQVINPSSEAICATIALGNQQDTDAAVAAAKAAFSAWGMSSKADRREHLLTLQARYGERLDEMAEAISTEMGAPIDMARALQAPIGAMHMQNFINAFDAFEFDRPLNADAPNDRILYEPVGVAGLITPWNWPMNQVVLKVCAALAAGCTMVLKPSEIAPLSALLFADIVDKAGIPAGVFNLLNGDGEGVGTQLSGHPDIDLISFTGSTRAGKLISKNAADSIKRVHLELGGKGANIIFADAKKSATAGAFHCFHNTGQSCNAPTRMLVEQSIYDEVVEAATNAANQAEVDIASKSGRHIGPLVSKMQFDKVQAMIQTGIDEGARLVAGGTGKPEGLQQGYFVKPTVFADVNNDMAIAREEIFGPVLSIIPFDSEEQAIEIANDTPYGLTNYVQTADPARANRVARQLRSGMVEMNGQQRSAGSPFGGYKQSGNGREGGTWGLEDFLEVKAVSGWTA